MSATSRVVTALSALFLAACGTAGPPPPSPSNSVEVHVDPSRWQVEQGSSATFEVQVHVDGEAPPRLDLAVVFPLESTILWPDHATDMWTVTVTPGFDLTPGSYGMVLIATAGVATATAAVDLVVTRAPGIAVHLQGPDEIWANSSARITVSASGEGANEAEVIVRGIVLARVPVNDEVEIDLTSMNEGLYPLTARVRRGSELFEAPETIDLYVDRTKPSLVKVRPSLGAEHVRVGTHLEASFSERLRIEAIESIATSQPAGITLEAIRTSFGDGRTVEVDLAGEKGGMSASVTLSGITDLAGNEAAPVSFNWAYPFWFDLADGLNPVSGGTTEISRLAASAASSAYVARVGTAGVPPATFLRVSRLDGASWTDLPWINKGPFKLDLTVDPAGAPILTVAADASTGRGTFRFGGTFWQGLGAPNCDSGNSDFAFPVNGYNHRGFLTLACMKHETDRTRIFAHELSGSPPAWSLLGVVGESLLTEGVQAVAIGTGPGGTLFSWFDGGNLRWSLWDGSVWSHPIQSISDVEWVPHQLTWVDPGGVPYVSATTVLPDGSRRMVLEQWSGTSWQDLGTPLLDSVSTATESGPVALASDEAGNLHALWVAVSGAVSELRVSRWSGTEWISVEPVVEILPGIASITDPAVAFGGSDLYLLWTSRPDGQLHARMLNR
jgi:hypothetical protein